MHDNYPEVLELEKKRNLSKTQHKTSTPHAHAPGWNEHLASASEAFLKADSSTVTTNDLQSHTVDYLLSRHPIEDDQREALYTFDEVIGPLSGAVGSETEETSSTEIKETIKHRRRNPEPTPSEENIKADRGEI